MNRFSRRILGVMRLDAATFEDIEADARAWPQAALIVIASSVSAGIGLAPSLTLRTILVTIALWLVGWLSWASLVNYLGGGLFGLSAIAFRAAIEAVPEGSFVVRSLTMLVLSLALQSIVLGAWLALRYREAFMGSLREWRVSLGAGFLGAAASSGWFIAFSLTAAANVRTLALIEMPVAALFSRRFSGKGMAAHEWLGMCIVVSGLFLLLAAHA